MDFRLVHREGKFAPRRMDRSGFDSGQPRPRGFRRGFRLLPGNSIRVEEQKGDVVFVAGELFGAVSVATGICFKVSSKLSDILIGPERRMLFDKTHSYDAATHSYDSAVRCDQYGQTQHAPKTEGNEHLGLSFCRGHPKNCLFPLKASKEGVPARKTHAYFTLVPACLHVSPLFGVHLADLSRGRLGI